MSIALQTPVTIPATTLKIDHECRLLLMGSCFSDAIGARMGECGFDVMPNPFGTLYNPLSIEQCLSRSFDPKPLDADDVVFHNGLWHSWLHHGKFSNHDRNVLFADCMESLHKVSTRLRPQADNQAIKQSVLLFTFGTAFVFKHDGRVVSNCHKLPSSLFERSMLDIDGIVAVWRPLLERFRKEGHKVVFTVSPIRHLADGAHGNQLSKATLLLAVERLCGEGLAEYFPAYEIVLDELRDYRFYADDMTHPSQLAEEIVWQRFQETYMTADTLVLCEKHQRLTLMKRHRPMHQDSPEYERYQEGIARLEAELKQLHSPTHQK